MNQDVYQAAFTVGIWVAAIVAVVILFCLGLELLLGNKK